MAWYRGKWNTKYKKTEDNHEKDLKEEKELEKEKSPEVKEEIPLRKEGPKDIFSKAYEKKVLKSTRIAAYKPLKLANPSDQMLQIIGL